MSEPPPARPWRFYVQDMLTFATRALDYTAGFDRDSFVADRRTYDATLRNPAQIGEAATHVPEAARKAHPDVPWRRVIATRNRLIHAYLGIDDDTLWSIVQDDLPLLRRSVEELLASESHS
jgi:uncharacterized protein with HEPN domain